MREVEVKILEIDNDLIEKKILSLGGKFIEKVLIIDDFFDFHDRSLSERGAFLRIRSIGGRGEITYKGREKNIEGCKTRNEIQTEASDSRQLTAIIEKLGLEKGMHAEKARTSYNLGGVRIEIDEYPEIPPFLEIEGANEDSVRRAVEKLGFKMGDTTTKDWAEVLRVYRIEGDYISFEQ